jgi:hypothetical protein
MYFAPAQTDLVVDVPRIVAAPPRRNGDVAWDGFDVDGYLEDNYTCLHDMDRRILTELSPYYAGIPAGSVGRSLDLGTGPNLYPLMLAAAASRNLEALDHSAANVAYLRRTVRRGADPLWQPFWALCRSLNPALGQDLGAVLRTVRVHHASGFDLADRRYEMASMFFVAESVTGDSEEFAQMCRRFAATVVPGGHLVAAFMAGMPAYSLAGQTLPAFPLDEQTLEATMRPVTTGLRVWRLPADPTLPYDHDGVLLLTARRRGDRAGD